MTSLFRDDCDSSLTLGMIFDSISNAHERGVNLTSVNPSWRLLDVRGCPLDSDPLDGTEPRADKGAESRGEDRRQVGFATVRWGTLRKLDAEPDTQPNNCTESRVRLLLLQSHFERCSLWNDYRVAGRRDDSWAPELPVERAARDRRLTVLRADAHDTAVRNLGRQGWPEAECRARTSRDEDDHARE